MATSLKLIIIFYIFYNCYHIGSAGKPIGASCTGYGNVTGECVNLYKCPSAVVSYLYKDFGKPVPELSQVCSNEGAEPVVCCTDCFIDHEEESRGYRLDRFGQLVNLRQGPAAKAMCAQYFQDLPYPCQGKDEISLFIYLAANETCHLWSFTVPYVAGGRDANKREFPHMALLGYGDDVNTAQWLCGGAVISERFILTAAHCSSTGSRRPIAYAALGILKRTDPAESWQIYNVKNIIVHPQYKSPSKYHDIALVEVSGTIKFSKDVLPACLQTEGENIESVQAVGWGRLGHGKSLADNLQVADLLSFEDDKCGELYPPHRHLVNGYDATTQMCYGNPDKIVDTCEGDSGGPIHVDYKNCQYTIAGVTSFGRACGVKGAAGMYTRVQHYVPWIEKIVWPSFKIPRKIAKRKN